MDIYAMGRKWECNCEESARNVDREILMELYKELKRVGGDLYDISLRHEGDMDFQESILSAIQAVDRASHDVFFDAYKLKDQQ